MLRGVVSDSEAEPPPPPLCIRINVFKNHENAKKNHTKGATLSNHRHADLHRKCKDMYADAGNLELFRATISISERRHFIHRGVA